MPPNLAPSPLDGFKGLPLTAVVTTSGSACLVQFPDELRLYPDDACLHSLHQLLATTQADPVTVQYA
jgi:DNA polymerase III subunit alpha